MKEFNKLSILLALSLILVSCSSNNALETSPVDNGFSYSLDWNIGEDEVVAYKTAMNQIDSANPLISFNLDELFADNVISDGLRQQLSSLQLPESGSLISILERNSRGNITVNMIVEEINFSDAEARGGEILNQFMEAMEGTVQLRGEVTPDGEISSFYLNESQQNLLSIFFELPIGPVHVGDSWAIDVNCISFGAGFVVDNAERINRVEFAGLSETVEGQPVAILDYILAESAAGRLGSLQSNNATTTSMTCSFLGQGRFLVEEGRWEQLTGEFAVTSTGFMETNAVQHFALMLLEDVPQEYLDLE